MWASYKANNVEESVVMASLERLSLKDEREGTDPEMQYMIGYADDQASNTSEGILGHIRRNRKEKIDDDTAFGTSNTSHGWGYELALSCLLSEHLSYISCIYVGSFIDIDFCWNFNVQHLSCML